MPQEARLELKFRLQILALKMIAEIKHLKVGSEVQNKISLPAYQDSN